MNTWPYPDFPPAEFRALSEADKELCITMIRAFCAEIALQEARGMRPDPNE
ncbi:2'-5' RNA ligase [Achromobacter sp. LC458]|uniref:2'-5' RNA ligase n=1 Tax=Achromobacter spanius TaxID=217203 RepID=A0A2S5GIZ9_9BURK|nr:2'-5' RNA ligase [Achromobacter sp. B7]PPA72843.1 2'-5' RNA ligase [Achromobacter spanius]TRM53318.1 2'-5' RNA ligase [Achromobacter sp. LC458]HBL64682.1 2'-5' RNA ligase [Achromobacter sp.]HCQ48606.1 2'-5' RNA ligase [Achromobacter sp.]